MANNVYLISFLFQLDFIPLALYSRCYHTYGYNYFELDTIYCLSFCILFSFLALLVLLSYTTTKGISKKKRHKWSYPLNNG